MKANICRDCLHFRQHFIPWGDYFVPACCGHCVYPRLKHRTPDHPACPHFVKNETPWYKR